MARADGKSRDAEMRRNDTDRNPAGTGADRFQASDAPGTSSSQSRSTKSGAEHGGSKSAGRSTGGGKAGTSSRSEDHVAPASGREPHKERTPQGPNGNQGSGNQGPGNQRQGNQGSGNKGPGESRH